MRNHQRSSETPHKQAADEVASYRAWAKRKAVDVWKSPVPFEGTLAVDYLAFRGVDLAGLPFAFKCFRFIAAHPYVKRVRGQNMTFHTGPALISAIQDHRGRLAAVHQTWIDLSMPSGKAETPNPDLKNAPKPKLVQGGKKGGAIRLTGNACLSTLVMGEGIETTLSALVGVSGALGAASYWAGVDLGNMAGVMERVPGTRNSGIPDLSDLDAWLPPSNVTRLIFIKDGDSETKMTQAKLTSGLRRAMAMRPGLSAQIVRAGEGV